MKEKGAYKLPFVFHLYRRILNPCVNINYDLFMQKTADAEASW